MAQSKKKKSGSIMDKVIKTAKGKKDKPKIGRPATLPGVERIRTTVALTQDINTRLKIATIHEQNKRNNKVDASLLVQEALEAWLKKKKY